MTDEKKEAKDKKKALGRGLESLLPGRNLSVQQREIAERVLAGRDLSPRQRDIAESVLAAGASLGPLAPPTVPSEFKTGEDGRVLPVAHSKKEALMEAAFASRLDTVTALDAATTAQQRFSAEWLAERKIKSGEMVLELPLHLIERNPYQTRVTKLEDPELVELVESIKLHGVLEPVLVTPAQQSGPQGELYFLIAGERRWLACRRAGKTHIPAIVRKLPPFQLMVLTIIENLHRQDLNPMQQARAFRRLAEEFGQTQDEVAHQLGMPRAAVANYIRLTRVPEEMQKAVEEGRLSFGHAKVLMQLSAAATIPYMMDLARKVIAGRLSVRETEVLVEEFQHPPVKQPDKKVDPNVRAAEMEIERALGCRVKIKDRGGKGKIVIEYKSLEDFDRIVKAIG